MFEQLMQQAMPAFQGKDRNWKGFVQASTCKGML